MKTALFALLMFGTNAAMANVEANICFQKNQVQNFNAKSDTELDISGLGNSEYKLTLVPCTNLTFSESIGFRTWPADSFMVCEGDEVVVRNTGGNPPEDYCTIEKIEKLK